MSNRKFWIVLVLFGTLIIFWCLNSTNSTTQSLKDQPTTSRTHSKNTPTIVRKNTKKKRQRKPLPVLNDSDKGNVYQQLQSDSLSRIQCTAPDVFEDGVYRSTGKTRVQFALVQDGIFTGLISQPAGEVTLTQELWAKGIVRWEGTNPNDSIDCEIEVFNRIEVRGRVLWPDGEPAVDYRVNTCEHGEIVRTDELGQFVFTAAQGHPCYLIGVVDSEVGLGRGPTVIIDTTEDAIDVEVILPEEKELLGEKEIESLARKLYQMNTMSLKAENKRGDQIAEVKLSNLSNSQSRVIEALLDEEQWRIDAMEETLRLTGPDSDFEDKKEAIRQMFFQRYY
jgi:hypothetical protein